MNAPDDAEKRASFLSEVGIFLAMAKDHVAAIIGALTATLFLSGLSYVRGYYGTLGFGGHELSFPFETYVALGGVSVLATVLGTVLLGILLVMILVPLWIRWGGARTRESSSREPLEGQRLALTQLSVALVLAFAFVVTWAWIVPLGSLFNIPGTRSGAYVALFILGLAPLAAIVATVYLGRNLRGRALFLFFLAALVVLGPTATHSAAKYRAETIFADEERETRALVWWHEGAAPQGYVVVHQTEGAMYLVQQTSVTNGTSAFFALVLRPGEAWHVVLVPPGVSLDAAKREAPLRAP